VTARIFVSAGEPSGDLHGAGVVRALRARFPGAAIEAFGGPRMAAAGATVLFPMERYTVMGFAEILHKIPAHARLYRDLRRRFVAGRYDLAILIDYPGFHLRLAPAARRAGVPVLYYVAPQLWAWRPQRAARLRAAADRLAAIFPFEPPFFAGLGIEAEYVGHPLLDRVPWPTRAEARRALGLADTDRVLAVFPGSRRQEVDRLWPPFRDAARRLLADRSCTHALVATTPRGSYAGAGPLRLAGGDPLLVLAAADAALAKSGTTTLEAALCDVPMVVAYRVHPLTGLLARRLIRVPWVSPVNLIAGAPVVEELLQAEVTAEALWGRGRRLLDPTDPATVAQRAGLAVVRERLGGPGAAERVAAMAADLLP
jgi:lipid-A-disaccharide synthase